MMQYEELIIDKVIQESPTTVSLVFRFTLTAIPGNFIMLTDFESGEKPFSISYLDDEKFLVTVKKIGSFTNKIGSKKPGVKLYCRGPYGNIFTFPAEKKNDKNRLLVIGGGCGIAPLRFLAYELAKYSFNKITFILGGRTKEELLFREEIESLGVRVHYATDDGSFGFAGNVVGLIKSGIDLSEYDYYYAAGPELMMKACFDLLKDKPCEGEYLLERYMKCGIGICGQCTIDPVGIRMCIEGPIVKEDKLAQLTEFGSYTRDAYGKRVPFIECK